MSEPRNGNGAPSKVSVSREYLDARIDAAEHKLTVRIVLALIAGQVLARIPHVGDTVQMALAYVS